jgi:hypothetical protein
LGIADCGLIADFRLPFRNPQSEPGHNPQSGLREPQAALSSSKGAIRNARRGVLHWPIWPHAYTMLVVMIGWVFFRADTLTGAVAFLKAMAGFTIAAPGPYTVRWYLTSELWLALVSGAIGSTPWLPALAARLDGGAAAEHPAVAWSASLLGTAMLTALLVASIMQMAAHTYNPFIYFRF